MHAPLSDPGGILDTRLVASRTTAFRPLHAVGFPSLSLEEYPVDHNSPYFGAPARGLHPRSIQLRTPIAGGARGCHSCPAGEALVRWDLHLTGAHPLGNNNQFHGIAPTSKVSGLPWHEQRLVRLMLIDFVGSILFG